MSKGEEIVWPVTVIECPPVKVFSVRVYGKDVYGEKVIGEFVNDSLDKQVARKVAVPKKYNLEEAMKKVEGVLSEAVDVRVVVYTQPWKIGLKKTPEIFEIGLGGKDVNEKFEYAKGLLKKELFVGDVFEGGMKVDVHAVTKGKGFQGSIKKYGYFLRSHKSEKKRRGITLGQFTPSRIRWGIGMPGRMGYNVRTEYNKDLLLVGKDHEFVNPAGGFVRYGLVSGDYLLVKGSVPGPSKRLIRLVKNIRGCVGLGDSVSVKVVDRRSKQ